MFIARILTWYMVPLNREDIRIGEVVPLATDQAPSSSVLYSYPVIGLPPSAPAVKFTSR